MNTNSAAANPAPADRDLAAERELVMNLLAAADRVEQRIDNGLSHIKGITFSEYHLLFTLKNQHGSTATRVELARLVGRSPSGVTRALKPLEKLGFVTTTKDARDARRSLATLTDQGVELVDDATGVIDDSIEGFDLVSSLSSRQQDQVQAFLEALTRW
jgi:DNA-binding MarR family transcriptional regulator